MKKYLQNFSYKKLPNFEDSIFSSPPFSGFHQNIPKIIEFREPGAKVPFWLFSTNRGFRREKLQKASVLKILHGCAYVFGSITLL
jgi:O-phosphoseryl-tRNA(Cys) synthetase